MHVCVKLQIYTNKFVVQYKKSAWARKRIDKFIIIYAGLSAYGSECAYMDFFSGKRNDCNAISVGVFLMTPVTIVKRFLCLALQVGFLGWADSAWKHPFLQRR